MRIAITTMIWKRAKVFEVWAKATKRLIADFPDIDFVVTVAGSEGNHSLHRVEKHGFNYIEAPNNPLSEKARTRLQFTRGFNPDYVLP